MMKMHIGQQSDARSLLGTYIATEVPGEFKWENGVLTHCMLNGKWLLIEDIDLAPVEILSVLIPLLESNKLFIPSRSQLIVPKPGFQLFATLSHSTTQQQRNKKKNSTIYAFVD